MGRRAFGYLLVASLIGLGSWLTARSAGPDSDQTVRGSWVTQMTFTGPVPPGLPPSFSTLETYFEGGDLVSSIALPSTTGGHGSYISQGEDHFATRVKILIIGGPGVAFPGKHPSRGSGVYPCTSPIRHIHFDICSDF